jgi:hypothetical protein
VWSNPQHLDLFITSKDGQVMSTWWEAAQSWQPWFAIHPESATGPPGQPVSAVWSNPQHLDLFITSSDGRVMSTWWEGPKSWQPWFAIYTDLQMERLADRRNVLTQLYNNSRSGAYLAETVLTPGNVNSQQFGKLYQRQVEGQILAQPLYIREVDIVGHGQKNLLIVGTAANIVYAFDADNRDSAADAGLIFNRTLHPSQALSGGHHSKVDICGETVPPYIGITSTPVIDPATNIMYAVAYSSSDEKHYLHALSLTDGLKDVVPPVTITSPGFDPMSQRNRPALLMLNQVIYVAFGSFICDNPQPYSGWVFGYRAIDLAQVAAYRTPVSLNGGGIWQSGRGLVGGADGSVYFMTGNDNSYSSKNPNSQIPSANTLANSFVRLGAACHDEGLSFQEAYTPVNTIMLSEGDTDLGSSGPLLLPENRLIGGGKQGRLYVLDATTMKLTQNQSESDGFDGFQGFVNTHHDDQTQPSCTAPDDAESVCRDINLSPLRHGQIAGLLAVRVTAGNGCYISHTCYQFDQGAGPNIHAGLVYWEGSEAKFGNLYGLAEKEYLRAFHYDLTSGHVEEKPVMTDQNLQAPDGMPGGALSVSANGIRDGIVWVSVHKEDAMFDIHPGRLVAVDATTLRELWRDEEIPFFAKFNPPTVADGKVFLGTFAKPDAQHSDGLGWVMVYGLTH